MPIKAVNAIPASKPHEAFLVFNYGSNCLVGKPLFSRIIFNLALWLPVGICYSKQNNQAKIIYVFASSPHVEPLSQNQDFVSICTHFSEAYINFSNHLVL
jgi:hypothetical protein